MATPVSVVNWSVALPWIVEVAGVMVTVPAPIFTGWKEKPASNPAVPAWGSVTAIGLALEKVTTQPRSPERTV